MESGWSFIRLGANPTTNDYASQDEGLSPVGVQYIVPNLTVDLGLIRLPVPLASQRARIMMVRLPYAQEVTSDLLLGRIFEIDLRYDARAQWFVPHSCQGQVGLVVNSRSMPGMSI